MGKYTLAVLLLIANIYQITCEETFSMDNFEKDKILACSQILSKKHVQNKKRIDETTITFSDKIKAENKIAADMMIQCYNKVSDKVVKKIANNLVFTDFAWNEDLDQLVEVDLTLYITQNDIELTPEQNILLQKIMTIKDEFMNANSGNQKKQAVPNQGLHIFGIDISQISKEFKLLVMIFAFALIALGFVYGLKQLRKKEEVTGNKKYKKKNN